MMQSKLFFCLLALAPVFAQETPAAVSQTEAPKTTPPANQNELQANIGFNATTARVEFCLIKEIESVDKTVWQNLKKSVRDCGQLIKNKQYEQAGALLDTIKKNKPEGVVALFIINAGTDSALVHARVDYTTASIRVAKGQCKCTLCEINKAGVIQENWKTVLELVFGAMRSNQELAYDQAKQLAFLIISKAS